MARAEGRRLVLAGRMEFGPARSWGPAASWVTRAAPQMQSVMNLKIKYRESFRPFAPSCLQEDVSEYFELDRASPYMLLVAPVQQKRRRAMTAEETNLFGVEQLKVPRSDIPAITHIDYSARVQTVDRDHQPRLLRPDPGVQSQDRLWRHRQHLLQRAGRADRLHTAGRLSLLSCAPRWTCWCWRTLFYTSRSNRCSRKRSTGSQLYDLD